MQPLNIFWFRRDLRIPDNHGLYKALQSSLPVLPVFIFDSNILQDLPEDDPRVEFIHMQVVQLKTAFEKQNSSLLTFHATPAEAFESLCKKYIISHVFANDDYDPYAIGRDAAIQSLLKKKNIQFSVYKDHVLFEKAEVVKDNGEPYTVFTPYSRKWMGVYDKDAIKEWPSQKLLSKLFQTSPFESPSLTELGFKKSRISFPPATIDAGVIDDYAKQRDFPALSGTSHLGVHLRFGTISIRRLAAASRKSSVFLNELIWREFYQSILWHFPRVVHNCFKPVYENIEWRDDPNGFERWCNGTTGYPIVDAGMRELNATGFMHNRVRMVTASFLTKHLLINWRLGEAYFAEKLLDYELASNNGGWQWAAGCGCDAAPYFRIFNPTLQTKKFDPQLEYIRKWVPEFESLTYPAPIIAHDFARKRCLEVYSKAVNANR
jgi:deoxyribodipyrimidine photo-lyase